MTSQPSRKKLAKLLGLNSFYGRSTAALTKNADATYANIAGLSANISGGGNYRFKVAIPSTVASGTAGIKFCFNYTNGLVLSALEATSKGYLDAVAPAVQHTTTTTTQTDLFTKAAVITFTEIEGTFTVSAAGTLNVQMAQNTSNASNTVALVGATLEIVRIP